MGSAGSGSAAEESAQSEPHSGLAARQSGDKPGPGARQWEVQVPPLLQGLRGRVGVLGACHGEAELQESRLGKDRLVVRGVRAAELLGRQPQSCAPPDDRGGPWSQPAALEGIPCYAVGDHGGLEDGVRGL